MKCKASQMFGNGLIWFGAAVSIAEILTGTLIAPLGFQKGFAAVLLGHLIGCVPLYLAALIGARTKKSAMETVKISFGQKGSVFFSLLNITQLVGWTAVMIIGGSHALSSVSEMWFGSPLTPLWSVVIGCLVVVWVINGIENVNKLNMFAMSALFLLTIVLSITIFRGGGVAGTSGGMSFGAAVELSAAMPLSWLPLIADYTREAEKARTVSFVSVAVYFFTSCWMYAIGLGAAVFTGQSDIALIMLRAGMGIAAVFIIIFSTVTTTFLDVYSAGVSFSTISEKSSQKIAAIVACVAGTLLAIFTPIEQFENFLYLIGSVFAPMVSVLIVDFFIAKKDHTSEAVNVKNFVLWLVGFSIYRFFMTAETPIGNTLPVMIAVCMLGALVNALCGKTADVR